jgi:hypothetical protein
LRIEIIDVGKVAGGKEAVAYVAYGPLNATLLVAARHRHRARLVTVVSGEAEQCRVEADGIAASFQDSTFKIVIEQDARHALPGFEGGYVAAQEVLHPGIQKEAQEDLARVAQHHDERHQWAACPANREVSKMTPVDLCLFAGQCAQT